MVCMASHGVQQFGQRSSMMVRRELSIGADNINALFDDSASSISDATGS